MGTNSTCTQTGRERFLLLPCARVCECNMKRASRSFFVRTPANEKLEEQERKERMWFGICEFSVFQTTHTYIRERDWNERQTNVRTAPDWQTSTERKERERETESLRELRAKYITSIRAATLYTHIHRMRCVFVREEKMRQDWICSSSIARMCSCLFEIVNEPKSCETNERLRILNKGRNEVRRQEVRREKEKE